MEEINFRPSFSSVSTSSGNIKKLANKTNQIEQRYINANSTEGLRRQQSLVSNYEKALGAGQTSKSEQTKNNIIDKNKLRAKLEELKNKIIKLLQQATNKVSSIEQSKRLNKVLDLIKSGVHLSEIILGINSLREVFPDLANYIKDLMEKYSEIHGYFDTFKDIAEGASELVKELSKKYSIIKKLLDSKVSNILSKVGSKILAKLGPFAKIAGIIGKAVEVVLSIKEAVDIIVSDKSIEKKGFDLAHLIIKKVLDIGGFYALSAIGMAIGGPIGSAVGMLAAGIIGLVGSWDWVADRLKDIGATKFFADTIIIPILKLFEKPSLATSNT